MRDRWDRLVASAGAREEVAQQAPVARDDIRFLGEFALSTDQGGFTADVEESGGKLPIAGAYRVPVLLDQEYAAVLVESEDGDRAGVIHVFAGDLPVAVREPITADVPHSAAEHHLGGDHIHGPVVIE